MIWLITFSACSVLLKPKCQKISSTRCNNFSLKRKRFVNFRPSASTHPEKIASQHARHGQHQEWHYLHFDSKSSTTYASLVGYQSGIPKIEAR